MGAEGVGDGPRGGGLSPRAYLERDFQAQLIEAAHLLGWRVYSIPDSRRATLKGWPDLVLWKVKPNQPPRLIFAELKTDAGRLSPEQKSVLADLEAIAEQAGGTLEVYTWRPREWAAIQRTLGGQQGFFD